MYPLLTRRVEETRISHGEIARALDLSLASFEEKLGGSAEFTLDEALALRELLCVSDPLSELFGASAPGRLTPKERKTTTAEGTALCLSLQRP